MAIAVIMPKAGMDMQEGVIIKWLVDVGDKIEEGEPLLEIETDKVTMEVEAPATGTLLCRYFEDSAVVPVVTTIAYIGEDGEDVPKEASIFGAPKNETIPVKVQAPQEVTLIETFEPANGIPATPFAKKLAKEHNINLAQVIPTGSMGEVKGRDIESTINATPLATRIADDMGIHLNTVVGSGHDGKITKADVLATTIQVATPVSNTVQRRTKLAGMRKIVATRMMQAHTEIPSATMNINVDVTKMLEFRKALNQDREEKFSINDLLLKTVAKALTRHRDLLMSIDGDEIIHHDEINIGMAVALDKGLIVPVIKNADHMSLEAIAISAKDLATRAKTGKLELSEYQGSTFSISNLGMFGLSSFTPIINLPDSMILGICGIEDVLALENEQVVVKKKMGLSLTFDHRILDGVPPAKLLNTLKGLLENPIQILL